MDISVDGGKTWAEAQRYQKTNVPYASDDMNSDKWAWVLFEAVVDIPEDAEIIAKAVFFAIFSRVVCNFSFSPQCLFTYFTAAHHAWTG